MKRYITAFLTIILCANGYVRAQENTSLGEMLRKGLENNYSVRIVRNNQEISDNNVTLGNAGFLPTVSVSGGYTGSHDHMRYTPVDGDEYTNNAFNNTVNLGLNVNWTLFNGFQVQTNYKRLQELQELGEINTRMAIEDFIADFSAQYYNLIRQQLRLNNYAYNLQLSRERVDIQTSREAVGVSSKLDYLQALVDYNADSSQYMYQIQTIRDIQINIRELLADMNYTVPVNVTDTLIAINKGLVFDELRQQTLMSNAVLMASDKDIELAKLDLDVLRARNYPSVNLGTGYGYTFNRYGSGTNRQRNNLGFNIGATVGITIFDGNRHRLQKNARISIETAKIRREQAEASVMADLTSLWMAYQDYLHIVEMERQNLVSAKRNFQGATDKNMEGTISGIEMREAQTNLLNAEDRLLTALYNTKLCEISLHQLSGSIVGYAE